MDGCKMCMINCVKPYLTYCIIRVCVFNYCYDILDDVGEYLELCLGEY